MMRWVGRLVGLLFVAGVVFLGPLGSSPAAAACEPDGIPDRAGSGLPGQIDDRVKDPSGKTYYGEYGWGGLRWYTCDLGTGPDAAADPEAIFDNWLGNKGLAGGSTLGSMMTQLHQWASDPGEVMSPVDRIVDDLTELTQKVIWNEYVAAVIVVAAALMLARAMNGETRRAVRTYAAVGAACLAVAWVNAGPVKAAQAFDGVVTEVVGEVDRSVTSLTGTAGVSADEARGATLQDDILFHFWAEGALDDPAAIDEYGDKLYKTQTVKYADLDTFANSEPVEKNGLECVDDPYIECETESTEASESRRDTYADLAEEIRNDSEATYDTLRGTDDNRAGQGWFAFLFMLVIAIIRIPAELLLVLGLLVIRLVVMFAPLFALTAILEETRAVARFALKAVIAAVVNVAIFGMIASFHTGIVSAVVTNSDNLVAAFFIVVCLTVVIWIISKPFRSATKLANNDDMANQMSGRGLMEKIDAPLGYILGRRKNGGDDGQKPQPDGTGDEWSRADEDDESTHRPPPPFDGPGGDPGGDPSRPPLGGPSDNPSSDPGSATAVQERSPELGSTAQFDQTSIQLDSDGNIVNDNLSSESPGPFDGEGTLYPPREWGTPLDRGDDTVFRPSGSRVVETDPVMVGTNTRRGGPGRGVRDMGLPGGSQHVDVEVPVQLIEPEYDAAGDLTYDTFRAGWDEVSMSARALVRGNGDRR